MNDRPLILTHAHCPDGFTAAWAAWLKYGDGADYRFMLYDSDEPSDEELRGRSVFFTDFTFNEPEKMARILRLAGSMTVLDHHKTAGPGLEAITEGMDDASSSHAIVAGKPPELTRLDATSERLTVRFDKYKSGAMLAWEHFHPDLAPPPLVRYVQDRDLWTWLLPDSEAYNSCLSSYDFDYKTWSRLSETDTQTMIEHGTSINRYRQREIRAAQQNAREVVFEGHKVRIANASILVSDICGELARGRAFGMTWFQRSNGRVSVSLRVRDGDCDVGEIAKRHGGGGHTKAAGFACDMADMEGLLR